MVVVLALIGVMTEVLAFSFVVLSDAPDGVLEVVEDSGLMLDTGAVMVDSLPSRVLGSARMKELKCSPI